MIVDLGCLCRLRWTTLCLMHIRNLCWRPSTWCLGLHSCPFRVWCLRIEYFLSLPCLVLILRVRMWPERHARRRVFVLKFLLLRLLLLICDLRCLSVELRWALSGSACLLWTGWLLYCNHWHSANVHWTRIIKRLSKLLSLGCNSLCCDRHCFNWVSVRCEVYWVSSTIWSDGLATASKLSILLILHRHAFWRYLELVALSEVIVIHLLLILIVISCGR